MTTGQSCYFPCLALSKSGRTAAGAETDPSLRRVRGDLPGGAVLVVHQEPARAFAERLERLAARAGLTPRQVEVAALVVRGLANKEIAASLACATHTVELHVTDVLKRSGLATRTALVAAFWSG